MNILIADSGRFQLIAGAFDSDSANVYRFDQLKPKGEKEPPPEGFLIRFRHGSEYSRDDEYSQLPAAKLNICIGGYGSALQNKKSDEMAFYKSLSSGDDFKKEDADALIRFATGESAYLPKCLLPATHNEGLEADTANKFDKAVVFEEPGFPKLQLRHGSSVLLLSIPGKDDEQRNYKEWVTSKILTGEHSLKVVLNFKDWMATIPEVTEFDAIIIFLELKWQTSYFTAFEGIDYLADLRRQGCRAPVLLCSYAPWTRIQEIAAKNMKRFDILRTPAQYFIDLSTGIMAEEALAELLFYTQTPGLNPSCRLSTALLDDIRYYVLNPRGQLHNYMHSLKNRIQDIPEQAAADVERFFATQLRQLVPPVNYVHLEEIKRNILAKIKETVSTAIYVDFIQPHIDRLEALIPLGSGDTLPAAENEWSVLYIEDQEEERKKVERFFNERKLNCYSTGNVESAISILKEDFKGKLTGKPNSITLLLTDFRLLTADRADSRWQPMQGLDFIDYAHLNLPNVLSFAILTNKRGALMRQAQKMARSSIAWFSKELLSNEATARFFLEDIRVLGQEAREALTSMPDSDAWQNGCEGKFGPLRDWYAYYLNASAYGELEQEINNLALDFLYLNDLQKNKIPHPKESREEVKNRIKSHRLFDCGYTAKLVKEKKETAARKQATATRPAKKNEKKAALDEFGSNKAYEEYPKNAPGKLYVFAAKLLGRRVTLALANQEKNLRLDTVDKQEIMQQIFNLLRLREPNSDEDINFVVFIQHFALSNNLDKIKSAKKLPEEIRFLQIAEDAIKEWRSLRMNAKTGQ